MDATVTLKPDLPPGPDLWNTLKPLWSIQRDRITPIQRLMMKYGDISTVRVGPMRFFFLNHPEIIQECLVTRHRDFHKDRGYAFLKYLLGNGLLVSEEEFHLRQRRMIQPAFHRKRIAGYGQAMIDFAVETRDAWTDGEERDIYRDMMALALMIVGRALFNKEVREHTRLVADALDNIMAFEEVFMTPWGQVALRLPLPRTRRFKQAITQLDSIIYGLIEERKQSGDVGDLVSMLLAAQDEEDGSRMTDKQVRDETITLFAAGHETTAIALTWAWYALSQNPEVEARLHEELDQVLGGRSPQPEDYPRLPYTRQVFAETMRMFPPAYMVGREAIRDTELGGYRIPRNSQVVLSPFITQRDPRFHEDPLRFDPSRFTPEAEAARHKFAYFPFGGGKRLCIGEGFAWMEGVLVLATLAQRWQLRLKPGFEIGFDPRVTLRPKGGMPMTLHRR
ncbi:MAG: cytochrome P450 [Candidatus Hydrogenedentes bacterium]|nr:cytochrome P450 [Candidatus Hydrogenedentota bacterium]